jgi:two-component system chemotaxis response regulator CheB
MAGRDIVAVGASAGGIESVVEIVRKLPADFPGVVFVVVHFPGSVTSTLPRILSRAGPLSARHAKDGEPVHPGLIYVPPPECHLTSTFTEQAMDAEHHASGIRTVLHSGIRSAAMSDTTAAAAAG